MPGGWTVPVLQYWPAAVFRHVRLRLRQSKIASSTMSLTWLPISITRRPWSRSVTGSIRSWISRCSSSWKALTLSDQSKTAPHFTYCVAHIWEEGQILAEPTAGNTGIALAALANAQGQPIELAVPDGTPEEKKTLLRFLGAELLEVEDELCPLFPTEGARGVVKSLVESAAFNGKYVSPNQYENELNVEAHYRTTGPEIWRQTGGDIDYFFCSFRYLRNHHRGRAIPQGTEPGYQNHWYRACFKAAQAIRHQENFRPAGAVCAKNPGYVSD